MMKIPRLPFLTAVVIFLLNLHPPLFGQAWQAPARIDSFTPEGTVKRVRQVKVRFSESMVPFGDLRDVAAPFEIDCPEAGSPRWIDDRNWVYDFDRDLPAGMRCQFKVRQGLQTLLGKAVSGPNAYAFSTGGPAVVETRPYEGAESIAEDQIFILELDAAADEASVLASVYFAIDGVSSRIGARIVSGAEREAVVKNAYRYYDEPPEHLLLVQARQRFPEDTRVTLVWGRGVASKSGVVNAEDQVLPFETRKVFSASFTCERENEEADCTPVSPMRVNFSALVATAEAKKAVLSGPGGRKWTPAVRYDEDGGDADWQFASSVSFEGPFPAMSELTLKLPAGLKDDAGRALDNAGQFPLKVRTDDYPPLAKFAANFGILELKDSPVLPVTLRNVEESVKARLLTSVSPQRLERDTEQKQIRGQVQGRTFRISTLEEMLEWMDRTRYRSWEDRDKSVFDAETKQKTYAFDIPKPEGGKAFEVVGIPLKEPGFYVVELESRILGEALLGKSAPMYVQATALVTNLAVHFKWGDDSSLVWVTTLDEAKPVPGAAIGIRDCEGHVLWSGKTDKDGVARTDALSRLDKLPYCNGSYLSSGLAVTARAGVDMSFVLTNWDEGIEPWRFQLPTEWRPEPLQAHTVFDRTLFRPGETAHMKHILRRRTLDGFATPSAGAVENTVTIVHEGSEQKYEIELRNRAGGKVESSWDIPKDAKLGVYSVYLRKSGGDEDDDYASRVPAGSFRVEEYRVPLMRAFIRAPAETLVAPKSVPVDLTATYLAGGGAGNLPVKFRYLVSPRDLSAPDGYDGFSFDYGKVKVGVSRYDEGGGRAQAPDVKRKDLTLGPQGSARTEIAGLPEIGAPMDILAEMDFKDPNGETQTVSTHIPLWPSSRQVGVKPDGWALSRDSLKFQVAVLDLRGQPVAGAAVETALFERKTYSHRKRLVGGFYAYEHSTETRKVQPLCSGKTDKRGLLLCETAVSASGSLIIEATTKDEAGREASASDSVWVAGDRDWWFAASDSDRMDVLPEAKRYEPGDKMRLQVRMPFRQATALVTVEREGVAETFVRELSGKEPVIELPVKGNWAPNVFVSVLAVRGRANEVQPTATVDLGRPAFRLGIAEVKVGWKTHELKVKVSPEREVYKVREKAKVRFAVATADGAPLPGGSEIAVAAVDEGLLELKPNESWNLLAAMMGQRPYGVRTYTAQMQVVGKRHFGLKALPQGGGGGQGLTRELFDTLLLWKGTLKLDAKGEAEVEIPLNDSLTSFRVVAVATGGADRFGSGAASIRTSQDLIIFSGVSPLVREGDRFAATFTARNATERPMKASLSLAVEPSAGLGGPASQQVELAAGESREIRFDLSAPQGVDSLKYTLEAVADGGAADRMSVTQKVVPAVPVRVWQATLAQMDGKLSLPVQRPADAVAGAGELRVLFQAKLTNGLGGVTDYMRRYPYSCLEQQVSKAVVLRDSGQWESIGAALPAYLDGDGLAKYFPVMRQGDDALTAYLVSVAHEAGWKIPAGAKERMLKGLQGFVEGRVVRGSALPTSDLVMRKLSALEALAREGKATAELLSPIAVAPNLWPTSAVIDWLNILARVADYPARAARVKEAQQVLRSRLTLQGTTMGFSTERSDKLWWLMVSGDSNAVRLLLSELKDPEWKQDIPRLVQGALGRQQSGHWDTTVANAWGRLAMEKFSKEFENVPVTGRSVASLEEPGKAAAKKEVDWRAHPKGDAVAFAWPAARAQLSLETAGTGKPWAVVQSLAAVPLKAPVSSGFKVTRTVTPVEQRKKGVWSAGDVVRVKLEMESQSDMTWVVVSDPVPAGASILGTGLGRDSALSAGGEKREGWVWPAFEERSFEAYREYYDFVPKGRWSTEYTMRLNGAGLFQLPPTRVEAMYSPEMFGESPNPSVEVK
ncbi:MAG: alpha-2-macroglobulin [Acidobacteriota bacterium]|jgi:uncharacterized protein YfaS (alpha-2-macroglobulin family)|nr:alpha-2-macroglobulin [Acidobacteriota bacterium]